MTTSSAPLGQERPGEGMVERLPDDITVGDMLAMEPEAFGVYGHDWLELHDEALAAHANGMSLPQYMERIENEDIDFASPYDEQLNAIRALEDGIEIVLETDGSAHATFILAGDGRAKVFYRRPAVRDRILASRILQLPPIEWSLQAAIQLQEKASPPRDRAWYLALPVRNLNALITVLYPFVVKSAELARRRITSRAR